MIVHFRLYSSLSAPINGWESNLISWRWSCEP